MHSCDYCLLAIIKRETIISNENAVVVTYDPSRTYDDGDGKKDIIEMQCDICHREAGKWHIDRYTKY